MSWSLTINGRLYSKELLESDGGKGYYTLKYEINGVEYPIFYAGLVDALSIANTKLITTSSTSNSVAAGSKTFDLDADIPFPPGSFVWAVDTANPTTKKMYGEVQSYNASTTELIISVSDVVGSGTVTSWSIFSAGPKGAPGTGSLGTEFSSASEVTSVGLTEEFIINSGGSFKKINYEELHKQLVFSSQYFS